MAWRDILEIVFSYIQYFLLLAAVKPSPFPEYYNFPRDVLNLKYLNLDLESKLAEWNRGGFLSNIPEMFRFDIRMQFIVVSVGFPLLVAWIALLILCSKLFVLWYVMLLTSMFFTFLGSYGRLAKDPNLDSQLSPQRQLFSAIAGSCGLVLCIAAYFIHRLAVKGQQEQKQSDSRRRRDSLASTIKDDIKNQSVWKQFERAIWFCLLLFFGLIFIRAISIPVLLSWMGEYTSSFFFAIGVTFIVVAGLIFIWMMIGCSRRGRIIQFKVENFLRHNFLDMLLLLISLLYVPTAASILIMVNCNDFRCPMYSRLPQERSLVTVNNFPELEYNMSSGVAIAIANSSADFLQRSLLTAATWHNIQSVLASPSVTCNVCDFTQFTQKCSVTLQQQLCGNSSFDSRLEYGRAVRCAAVKPYFWPPAGLMFFAFVVATPIVNWLLTAMSTRRLEERFPLDSRQTQGYTEEERYEEMVLVSSNVAKFIYSPFHKRFKHWRMLFLVQKLFVVAAAVFVFRTEITNSVSLSIALSLVVHLTTVLYLTITHPFNRKAENYLTNVTQWMLVATCVLGYANSLGAGIPLVFFLMLAIACIAGPIVWACAGGVLTVRDDLTKQQARDERILQAQEEAEEDDSAAVAKRSVIPDGNDDEGDGEDVNEGPAPEPTTAAPTSKWVAPFSPQPSVETAGLGLSIQVSAGDIVPCESSAAFETSPQQQRGGGRSPGARSPQASSKPTTTAPRPLVAPSTFLRRRAASDAAAAWNPPPNAAAWGNAPLCIAAEKSKRDICKIGAAKPAAVATFLAQRAPKAQDSSVNSDASSPSSLQRQMDKWDNVKLALEVHAKNVADVRSEELAEHCLREKQEKLWGADIKELDDEAPSFDAKRKYGRFANEKMKKWDRILETLRAAAVKDIKKKTRTTDERRLSLKAHHKIENQMRLKLKRLYERHLRKIRSVQMSADFEIDHSTVNVMSVFFFTTSLFSFLALLWCVIGLYVRDGEEEREARFLRVPRTRIYPELLETAFAHYGTFDFFTGNCCCTAFVNQTAFYPHFALDVEVWRCVNGKSKEMIRRRRFIDPDDSEVTELNGYGIRPLCGMALDPPCAHEMVSHTLQIGVPGAVTPSYSAPKDAVRLRSCNWTTVVRVGTSSTAADAFTGEIAFDEFRVRDRELEQLW